MLSAQCTDTIVNRITPALFKKYPTTQSFAETSLDELEKDIRSAGFFRTKAKHINKAAQIIMKKHHGNVPNTMEELTALPGVARKTANIVLSNAFGMLVGIAVDTHVSRITQRLRFFPIHLTHGTLPVMGGIGHKRTVEYYKLTDTNRIEKALMRIIPKNEWNTITYQLIEHGRAICKAQSPRCHVCPIAHLCPSSHNPYVET
jgi:endonuclease-3